MTKKLDKFQDILAPLSMNDKIELFDILLVEITGRGVNGDTKLAHINDYEDKLLRSVGGAGSINSQTGLRQYFGGGSKATTPTSQTVTQQATIPPEIAPYITDILGRAQAIQEKRETEGFVPYTGQQIAEFTPEQEKAFQGISGLVGTGQQYFAPAAALTASSAMAPTAETVGQFMSPYMQNVVDVQQREARRAADVQQQQLAAGAVGAGGFGGSRQAILEAEQQRNLQQQLGDIQARGLASAYEDAQQRIAQQRGRELSAGAQFAGLGQAAPSVALQELGALQQVGGVRQAQTQTALDLARQQFEAERTYPEQLLQRYSSIIRGYQMDPNLMKSSQTFAPAPSYLQQFAGFGVGAGSLAKAFGAFKEGGRIRPNSRNGLSSIVIRRKKGGKVMRLQSGGSPQLDAEKEASDIAGMGIGMLRTGVLSPAQQAAEQAEYRRLAEERAAGRRGISERRQALADKIGQVSPAEQELLKYYQEERAQAPQRRAAVTAETEAEREAINRAKFFELANVGFRFADPQGGTGGVLSDLVRSLQPSVSEFGRLSAAEAGLVKQQRKELQALSDRERELLAKEAGISRDQLDRQLKAEDLKLKVEEETLDLDLDLQKDLMSIDRDARKENREGAQVAAQYLNAVTDYAAKLAKANEVKQPSSSDINSIKASVAQMYGFTFDPETGSIKLGGNVLQATDPILAEMANDNRDAIKAFIDARRAGGDGYNAAHTWIANRAAQRQARQGGRPPPPASPVSPASPAPPPNPNPLSLPIPTGRR